MVANCVDVKHALQEHLAAGTAACLLSLGNVLHKLGGSQAGNEHTSNARWIATPMCGCTVSSSSSAVSSTLTSSRVGAPLSSLSVAALLSLLALVSVALVSTPMLTLSAGVGAAAE